MSGGHEQAAAKSYTKTPFGKGKLRHKIILKCILSTGRCSVSCGHDEPLDAITNIKAESEGLTAVRFNTVPDCDSRRSEA